MDQLYDFNYFLFNTQCILVLYKMLCTIIYRIKVKVKVNNFKVKVKVIFEIFLELGGFLLWWASMPSM